MTNTSPYVPQINGTGTPLVHGEVVRVSVTNTVVRAQADSAPHLAGLLGINGSGTIGAGGSANIFTAGAQIDVLLESGLTPVAGQTIYVSASAAGRGTNVAPGTAVVLGTIETAVQYVRTGLVQIALALATSTSGGTGAQGAQGAQGTQGATGAQGSQGTQGLAISVDSVNTTGVTLSGLASAVYAPGQQANVTTVGDAFRLQQSALTVDNITVVNANGKAGYQWSRLNQPAPSNAFVAFWAVDPVNGNDENVGSGSTQAAADLVALKSMQEVKRRLWGLEVQQQTIVHLLTSMVSTDVGSWNTRVKPGFDLVFAGLVGATTGPGGALDTTLYSGSVTSRVVAADVPSADDMQIGDTAIPVSFTASGLLADGVMFKRLNGSARYWWALKDLGSKTIRVTAPMSNLTGLTSYGGGAVIVGDTYSAFLLPTWYQQDFGAASFNVLTQEVFDQSPFVSTLQPGQIGYAVGRDRNFIGGAALLILGVEHRNNMLSASGGNRAIISGTPNSATVLGGGARGNGTNVVAFFADVYVLAGCWISEGVPINTNDGGRVQIEKEIAIHDCTGGVPCLQATTAGSIISITIANVGQGISGKGNTGKLASATLGGQIYYGFNSALPPWTGASTTDASPILIGATSYALAAIPAAADTLLKPGVFFP